MNLFSECNERYCPADQVRDNSQIVAEKEHGEERYRSHPKN